MAVFLAGCPRGVGGSAPRAEGSRGSGNGGAPVVVVREVLGYARRSWPVSTGVPLPRGWLPPGASVTLTGTGGPVPAQTRLLARWPDGSARWLLVHFQADLDARGERRFALRSGTPVPPHTAVRVKDLARAIDVDTGALRFAVPKGRFGILENARVGTVAIVPGTAVTWVEADGKKIPAAAPSAVRLVEEGPLVAQIVLEGRYENGFAYRVRIFAYAGQSFVRILHTFVDVLNAEYTFLDRIALQLPVPLGPQPSYRAALEGGRALEGKAPPSGFVFAQPDSVEFRAGESTKLGRLAGWFEIRGREVAVAVHAPFFWQEYPQAITIAGDHVTYELWSPAGGRAKVGAGSAKTHEVVLAFGPAAEGGYPSMPAGSVVAYPEPKWTFVTDALPNAAPPQEATGLIEKAAASFERVVRTAETERWDDSGQVQCPPPEKERPRIGFYGMFHWGDWNFPGYHDNTKGCDAWGNQEYDFTQALALLFAATGRPDVFTHLVAAGRHYADVDCIHDSGRLAPWAGMNHPKNPLHFAVELGGIDLGHTWLEGLLSYYFLTGDERAREAAAGIAEYLARRISNPVVGNPRQFGWPALALAAAYGALGEERYRRAAVEYARRGLRAHGPARAPGGWKMGILADGLAYVHAISNDPEIEAWLRTYAAAIAEKRPKDPRYYPAVAYVARMTGDAKLAAVARQALGRLSFGSWGKPFTIAVRTGFRISALLARRAS